MINGLFSVVNEGVAIPAEVKEILRDFTKLTS